MNISDTIAAIATPHGEGGIGIIRLSGPDAKSIALKVFRGKRRRQNYTTHRLYHGTLIDSGSGTPVDECLLTVMYSPHSFTGEDVAELHCHGGRLVLNMALEAILKKGARLAEPGEFTKRAFLNGKMDLVQAEAVIELIRAKTGLALRVAQAHLGGQLSKAVNDIKSLLLNHLATIEADLDFPDEEGTHDLTISDSRKVLHKAQEDLKRIIGTYEGGTVLRDGIATVIAGRPNAGKSTLLNLLLGEERAIVTPIPGTTRDVIEDVVNLRGLPLRLMDTAGLRNTEDTIEAIGVMLTKERLKGAQLVLYVVDAAHNPEEDLDLLKDIKDKKVVTVINKIDMVDHAELKRISGIFAGGSVAKISASNREGIDQLEDIIFAQITGLPLHSEAEEGIVITSMRHKNALISALSALQRATDTIEGGLAGEFLALELREAVIRLGEVVGETATEEILDRIFGQFCIGK